MTNETLTALYYGNLDPVTRSYDRVSEYEKASKKILALADSLAAGMDESKIELLERYTDAINDAGEIELREMFMYAFKLGARIMLETLSEDASGAMHPITE